MSFQLEWDDSITGAKLNEAITSGLRHAAVLIKDEAVELTPRDTGDLRDSADVDAKGNQASVYYKKFYAPFVHENLTDHHKVGQAKFLETALDAHAEEALEAMGAEMQRVFGG